MRTRDEVLAKVVDIISAQLETDDVKPESLVREELGAISLDMAALQLSFEDEFGVQFALGTQQAEIDNAWEAAKTVDDFVALVLRFAP